MIIDLAEHTEHRDFVHRLQNGDATLGWRGDPNCTVARETDGSWAIYRLDDDCEWRRLLKARPGMRLDAQPLRMLAERDTHRERSPFNPADYIIKHNRAVDAAKDAEARERTANAFDAAMTQASSPSRSRRALK